MGTASSTSLSTSSTDLTPTNSSPRTASTCSTPFGSLRTRRVNGSNLRFHASDMVASGLSICGAKSPVVLFSGTALDSGKVVAAKLFGEAGNQATWRDCPVLRPSTLDVTELSKTHLIVSVFDQHKGNLLLGQVAFGMECFVQKESPSSLETGTPVKLKGILTRYGVPAGEFDLVLRLVAVLPQDTLKHSLPPILEPEHLLSKPQSIDQLDDRYDLDQDHPHLSVENCKSKGDDSCNTSSRDNQPDPFSSSTYQIEEPNRNTEEEDVDPTDSKPLISPSTHSYPDSPYVPFICTGRTSRQASFNI